MSRKMTKLLLHNFDNNFSHFGNGIFSSSAETENFFVKIGHFPQNFERNITTEVYKENVYSGSPVLGISRLRKTSSVSPIFSQKIGILLLSIILTVTACNLATKNFFQWIRKFFTENSAIFSKFWADCQDWDVGRYQENVYYQRHQEFIPIRKTPLYHPCTTPPRQKSL